MVFSPYGPTGSSNSARESLYFGVKDTQAQLSLSPERLFLNQGDLCLSFVPSAAPEGEENEKDIHNLKQKKKTKNHGGAPMVAQWVKNPASIHGNVGSKPDPAQSVKELVLP